jgi:hypothetical protein
MRTFAALALALAMFVVTFILLFYVLDPELLELLLCAAAGWAVGGWCVRSSAWLLKRKKE